MNNSIKVNWVKFKNKSIFVAVLFFIFLLTLYLYPLPEFKTYSKIIYSKDGTLLTAYLSEDDKWRLRTQLNEVSPDLIKAIIEKEDGWFYWHPGVNPFAVMRALYLNITSGERVSGASTITMQVARMLEPSERTYFNKILEMLRAFQIELHYSKDEILEMYLSLLPFGGNIEGVKSATYIYFNRPPGKLSLAQSVLLAAIPNDPNNLRIDYTVEDALKVRNYWINKFIEDEVFNKNNLLDALEEPLKSNRFSIPNTAPHFCLQVSSKYNNDVIKTSLDLKIQKTAENLLKNYVNRVSGKGVSNGAVLIIENKTSSVAGYCGSADFYNSQNSGQVNGITAVRSPGSTLKPALYALSFDLGELTPQVKLLDIPTDFSGYEPENYDLEFNGEVTAEYALVNSLNVPAVRLLQSTGFERFINLLGSSGFNTIRQSKERLGLSVILGGCGVSLEELTRFYSGLANEGKLFSLNYLENPGRNERKNIFSASASYLIANILSSNERPDFPNALLGSSKLPKIAWKTGTSYGKRDAWAVGFNPNYTIGVWMGNFDGKGSPHLSGAEMAVPLLFDLFNAVDFDPDKKWFDKPQELRTRKVCKETGLLLSENCTSSINDYFINNISHNKTCDLYKEIYVGENNKIEYCTECLPKEKYIKKAYPFYNPELVLWFAKNNIEFEKPPEHNINCTARFSNKGPKIISPVEDYEYYVEANSGQEILLQAASEAGVKFHYWYINDMFYKRSYSGEKVFYKPKAGTIKITCLDDRGRNESVNIIIKSY